jgi:hypothetical protein
MTKVTYVPRSHDDPASIVWNNITFPANFAVDLDPVRHSYFVPIVEVWIDPVSQEKRSKATEKRMAMAEIAKGNPSFQVEGMPVPRASAPGRSKPPKTPEEYRVHAMTWIKGADSLSDLERWNDEEMLREKCGCGEDDTNYLQPHFDAKFKQLSASEAA